MVAEGHQETYNAQAFMDLCVQRATLTMIRIARRGGPDRADARRRTDLQNEDFVYSL
jgi:hypothetical protein